MTAEMDLNPVAASILEAVQRQHGGRADISAVAACGPDLLAAFASGQRVKVHNRLTGDTRTGIVTRSRGWTPVLLLKYRGDTSGSSDVLNAQDQVIGWWDGRRYSPQPCPSPRGKK